MVGVDFSVISRERARALRNWLLGAALAVFSPGCRQILSDFSVQKDASLGAPDSGAAAEKCSKGTYPGVSVTANSGGTTSFVVLLHTRSWGDRGVTNGLPDYQVVGLNLDGYCTASHPSAACKEPSWADADHSDGPDGIDNAAGHAVYSVAGSSIAQNDYDNENHGVRAYLVRVSDYNGLPDDDNVHVAWFSATLSDHVTIAPVPDAGSPNLAWNVFAPFLQGTNPKYEALDAYVSNNVLVARFDQLQLGGPEAFVPVSSTILRANVVHDEEWGLDDIILAGRWPVAGIISILKAELCQVGCANSTESCSALLPFAKVACQNVDIASTSNAPADAPCDALSFGVLFDGSPGRLGPLTNPVSTSADTACDLGPGSVCEMYVTPPK